jgi:hypothetical protein
MNKARQIRIRRMDSVARHRRMEAAWSVALGVVLVTVLCTVTVLISARVACDIGPRPNGVCYALYR